MRVVLQEVRLAFGKIFEAKRTGDSEEKRFGAAFPIAPDSANHKLIEEAVQAVALEKWGKKGPDIVKALREARKVCYVHGPAKDESGEVYDGFEGMFTLNAGQAESKGAPTVVDRDRTKITDGKLGRPYNGSYNNVILDVWAQDNDFGKRINAQLKGLQFVKDGDAFGGGAPASPDDFEDLGVPSEEEMV